MSLKGFVYMLEIEVCVAEFDALFSPSLDILSDQSLGLHFLAMLLYEIPPVQFEVLHLVILLIQANLCYALFE